MLLGITGGVGTGKSTVARLLRQRGAVVFSADEAAREVTAPGSPALREIADTCGPEYILPDGSLDRARLGAFIFSHPEARRTLEAITHPRILARLREQVDAARRADPNALVAVEAPLLFEAGMDDWFDHIVVVSASEEAQVARLRERNHLDEADARRRIAAQMPLAEKEARADIVLRNEGTLEELEEAVKDILAANERK